jgi:hypothetical protein
MKPGITIITCNDGPVSTLTKRELFAAMAMQADLTGWRNSSDPLELDLLSGAIGWVKCADALLAELNKEEPCP